MLDRYTWGQVDRISPEAPIPILRVQREETRLGGAANAMTNLATLGTQVIACGVIGNDATGQAVQDWFHKLKIDPSGVFPQTNFTTILKHRMIAGHNHLLRMDFDPPSNWSPNCETEMLEFFEATIPQVQAVVISDYGKGVLTDPILDAVRALVKKHNVPTIVDPGRGADYARYRDFTLIKPNRQEAASATGIAVDDIDSACRAAERIQNVGNFDHVLMSLDQDGLLLFRNTNDYQLLASEAQEVFDVVGAGDMVVSVLAFMMAGQASIENAAFWANLAAGMEIMHVGVVSFTKSELLHKLELGHSSSKVVSLEHLLNHVKNQAEPIIFTNGYFDNISAGHLKFLQQLQKFKGVRVVAINSDRSIEQQKGKPPLLNEKDRASLLASIEAVDWVVLFDEPNVNQLITQLCPVIVVKGERYREQQLPEHAAIQRVGASVHYLPEYH